MGLGFLFQMMNVYTGIRWSRDSVNVGMLNMAPCQRVNCVVSELYLGVGWGARRKFLRAQ